MWVRLLSGRGRGGAGVGAAPGVRYRGAPGGAGAGRLPAGPLPPARSHRPHPARCAGVAGPGLGPASVAGRGGCWGAGQVSTSTSRASFGGIELRRRGRLGPPLLRVASGSRAIGGGALQWFVGKVSTQDNRRGCVGAGARSCGGVGVVLGMLGREALRARQVGSAGGAAGSSRAGQRRRARRMWGAGQVSTFTPRASRRRLGLDRAIGWGSRFECCEVAGRLGSEPSSGSLEK